MQNKQVIFDLVGVLFDWKPLDYLGAKLPNYCRTLGDAARLSEGIFQRYRDDWALFDKGLVDLQTIADRASDRTSIPADILRGLLEGIPDALLPIPHMMVLLQDLIATRHDIFFLSNLPSPYSDALEERHKLFGWFNDGIFSSRVQMIKPELRLFEYARVRFNFLPGNTVFVDDQEENVTAAKRFGLEVVHFSGSPAEAADMLRCRLRCAR